MNDFLKDSLENTKFLFSSPTLFFKKKVKGGSLKDTYKYFALLSFLALLFSLAFVYGIYPLLSQLAPQAFPSNEIKLDPATLLGYLVVSFAMAQISSFIYAFVLHLWLKIFKSKKPFGDTYKLYVYSRVPSLLLGWIPYIGVLTWAYGIYLMIAGAQNLLGFTRRRAIIAFAIPLVLLFVLIVYGSSALVTQYS